MYIVHIRCLMITVQHFTDLKQAGTNIYQLYFSQKSTGLLCNRTQLCAYTLLHSVVHPIVYHSDLCNYACSIQCVSNYIMLHIINNINISCVHWYEFIHRLGTVVCTFE